MTKYALGITLFTIHMGCSLSPTGLSARSQGDGPRLMGIERPAISGLLGQQPEVGLESRLRPIRESVSYGNLREAIANHPAGTWHFVFVALYAGPSPQSVDALLHQHDRETVVGHVTCMAFTEVEDGVVVLTNLPVEADSDSMHPALDEPTAQIRRIMVQRGDPELTAWLTLAQTVMDRPPVEDREIHLAAVSLSSHFMVVIGRSSTPEVVVAVNPAFGSDEIGLLHRGQIIPEVWGAMAELMKRLP